MIDYISSGRTLYAFLCGTGLLISKVTAIDSSENCIYLPDKTSFNWKAANGCIRVNCKEDAKSLIEQYTGKKMFDNGAGDKTRHFSLLIDSEDDLLNVVKALKSIEGNGLDVV